MIAYSHKEEADTKGNSRDPQKKEPVHHRKITRKQNVFHSREFKEEKEAIHERFPKSSRKHSGKQEERISGNGNSIRENQNRKRKQKHWEARDAKRAQKEHFFKRNLTGRTSKTEDAEKSVKDDVWSTWNLRKNQWNEVRSICRKRGLKMMLDNKNEQK